MIKKAVIEDGLTPEDPETKSVDEHLTKTAADAIEAAYKKPVEKEDSETPRS